MSVETPEFLAGVRRMVRAAGRRVAEADEPELAELAEMHSVVDEALLTAVQGWRRMGRSWAVIGGALGISRQAAEQRFGRRDAA